MVSGNTVMLLKKYTPMESFFKRYYDEHGTFCSQNLLQSEEVKALWKLRPDSSEIISEVDFSHPLEFYEDFFFDGKNDVAILRHQRYMPPFEHYHAFFEIIYIFYGQGKNIIDGGEILMHTGDICVVPPGVTHSIEVNTDSILINIMIRTSTFGETFTPMLKNSSILSEFFSQIMYSNNYKKYLLFHTKGDKVLDKLILDMYAEQVIKDVHYGNILNGLLVTFLGKLLQRHEQSVEYPASYYEKYDSVPKICRYIYKNCQTTSLSKCAEQFHFNPQYLGSLIKKHTNKTFSQLLTEARMDKATQMLLKHDISIQDLSRLLGYEDSAYFMKVFKKQFSCTPSEYRKIYKEAGSPL